jgi:hypothetical protein
VKRASRIAVIAKAAAVIVYAFASHNALSGTAVLQFTCTSVAERKRRSRRIRKLKNGFTEVSAAKPGKSSCMTVDSYGSANLRIAGFLVLGVNYKGIVRFAPNGALTSMPGGYRRQPRMTSKCTLSKESSEMVSKRVRRTSRIAVAVVGVVAAGLTFAGPAAAFPLFPGGPEIPVPVVAGVAGLDPALPGFMGTADQIPAPVPNCSAP